MGGPRGVGAVGGGCCGVGEGGRVEVLAVFELFRECRSARSGRHLPVPFRTVE